MAEAGDIYRARVRQEVEEEYRRQQQSRSGSASIVLSANAPGHGASGSSSLPGFAALALSPASPSIDVGGGGGGGASGPSTWSGSAPRLSPVSTSSGGASEVEVVGNGKKAKDTAARKSGVKWGGATTKVFMMQVGCDKPFLAKYDKRLKLGEEWEKCAQTISVVSPFSEVGGITGRGCKAKFKELLNSHREEVKNGEFTSGDRDGMDDATHDALNKCMQEIDEAVNFDAKTKGEMAEYEATKQERAEKALAFASKASGSGRRQKRKVSAGNSPTSSISLSSEEDEPSQKRRKVPVVVSVEDAVAKYFEDALDSPRTKERKLSMAEGKLEVDRAQTAVMVDLLKSAVDSPKTKAAKLAVQKTTADTRFKEVENQAENTRLQSENMRLQADSMKANQSFQQNMAVIMSKLADKLG